MLGKIKAFNRKKHFGFIEDESGQERFFHQKNLSEQFLPKPGLTVRFHPHEEPRGHAATAIRLVSGPGGNDFFEELVEWKMEAKLENSLRYFFYTEDVDRIEKGTRCFVIGRKGTGKTAICEHLASIKGPEIFCRKRTFQNFPFNELYKLSNDQYTSPNQFITLWKYIIYSTVASMMIQSEAVEEVVRSGLARLYGSDRSTTSFQSEVAEWTSRGFQFSILGSGFGLSQERQMKEGEESWVERVERLERIIMEHAGDSNFLIVFDELDEDYKNFAEPGQMDQYQSLLTSLFKAVLDVKSRFRNSGRRINPVVFLRDDIFQQLKDSDRSKWGDLTVELKWTEAKLRRLVSFRISRALNPNPTAELRACPEDFGPIAS